MKSLAEPRDKEELLRRLHRLRPDSPRRWGRMSVHQMLCHVADAFRMAMGEMEVSFDAHLFNRTVLKWTALYLPLPWPPGIVTRPELDQVLGAGTPPTEFQADVAQLEARLEAFSAALTSLDRRAHPLFGPLPSAAWLRWGYLHADHHLRQFGA